jgi:hypothetical protein
LAFRGAAEPAPPRSGMADSRTAAFRAIDHEVRYLRHTGKAGNLPPPPVMTDPSLVPDISTDQLVALARLYTSFRTAPDAVDTERTLRELCWKLCFGHGGAAQALNIQYSPRWCRMAARFFTTGDGTGRRIYLQLMVEQMQREKAELARKLDTATETNMKVISDARRDRDELHGRAQRLGALLREAEAAWERERERREQARPPVTSAETQTDPAPEPSGDPALELAPDPAPDPAVDSAPVQDALFCAGGCGRIVELTNLRGKRVLVESALQCAGCFALHLAADHPAPGWHCGACTADWRSVKRGRDPVCPDCLAR